jgi:hypothetical protein
MTVVGNNSKYVIPVPKKIKLCMDLTQYFHNNIQLPFDVHIGACAVDSTCKALL